ncbi:MAG: hypothetical protein ACYDB2_00570 [Acidimicrobiales bacterium]
MGRPVQRHARRLDGHIDASTDRIALANIFVGINVERLQPGTTFYLLERILGFMIVTSVSVGCLGRPGAMLGRVRMDNLGFVIYPAVSLLHSVTWMSGTVGGTLGAAGLFVLLLRLPANFTFATISSRRSIQRQGHC